MAAKTLSTVSSAKGDYPEKPTIVSYICPFWGLGCGHTATTNRHAYVEHYKMCYKIAQVTGVAIEEVTPAIEGMESDPVTIRACCGHKGCGPFRIEKLDDHVCKDFV